MKRLFIMTLATLFVCNLANAGSENSLGVFFGAKTSGSSSHGAYGLEFEHSLIPFVGINAFAEQVNTTPSTTAFGLGIAIHPIPFFGLKLVALPGLEQSGSRSDLLIRLGGSYEFSIGPLFAGPGAYLNMVNGHNFGLFGIIAGLQF